MGEPGQSYVWSPACEFIVRGWERWEVKHLSTSRKRYSVSSGERKWMSLNRVRVIAVGCCVCGVVGSIITLPTRGGAVINHGDSRTIWEG